MKKIILASASALALLATAACSDTDNTTTQSVNPPVEETQEPGLQVTPVPQADPTPQTGSGGQLQNNEIQSAPEQPLEPAPNQ